MDELDEENILEFIISVLKKKIKINIQNLMGHFSQLPSSLKGKLTKYEVKKLLLEHSDIFCISEDEMVELKSEKYLQKTSDSDFETDNENRSHTIIDNAKGKIVGIFNAYGFIELFQFPNTTVYFDVTSFEDSEEASLNNVANVGDTVVVKAKKTKGHKAQYRAIRVWKEKRHPSSWTSSSSIASASSQESERNEISNGIGKIVTFFTTYGYIRSLDRKYKIFFHKDKVVTSNNKMINSISNIFKIDDIVHFNAIPSTRDSNYEATKVWTAVEDYLDETENDYASESSISVQGYTVLSDDGDGGDDDDDDDDDYADGDDDEINHIYNKTGIFTFSKKDNCIAKIKFQDKQIIVLSDVPFYSKGNKSDLAWILDDDDEVQFDAEFQPDSGVWKALVVWQGNKPQEFAKQRNSKTSFKASANVLDQKNISDDNFQKTTSRNSFSSKPNPKSTYANKLSKSQTLQNYKNSTMIKNYSGSNSYKKDNGWNDDAFDIQNEEWPDLNTKSESNSDKNKKEYEKNKLENCFANNDLKHNKNLTLHKDQVKTSEVPKDLNVKDNFQSSTDVLKHENSDIETVSLFDQLKLFKNVTGKIKHLTKEYAFINCNRFTEEKPFNWEYVYYNGLCISENFSGLNEIFEENEQLNFNYLSYTDLDGKIWEKITLVWKGNKPKHFTEITPEQFLELMNIFSLTKSNTIKTSKTQDLNSTSKTGMKNKNLNCLQKSFAAHKIESNQKPVALINEIKISKELEDFSTCHEDDDKTNSSKKKISDAAKPSILETSKVLTELLPSSSNQTSNVNEVDDCRREKYQGDYIHKKEMCEKKFQTEIETCEMGTQTFITGKVLSFEIFPF